MLKVLQLSASTALAGAERVILNFLQTYESSSFSVHVALYLNHQRLQNSFTEALAVQGIAHDTIPIGNTTLFCQIRQTVKICKMYGIDIIHTHGYRSDFVGFLSAKFAGVPIISTVHGWTPVSFKLRAYQMLDRICLKWFEKVVCVSNRLYEEFSNFGIKGERLVYLPNAISLPEKCFEKREIARKQLGISQNEKIIVTIGRLSKEKGIDILLQAFARQFNSKREVRLIIVGDGPQSSGLKLLSHQLGISDNVFFTGFRSDVDNYYAAADLFVMASYTEGFPMSLLEAMAWSLPVVVTAVGGIPDIVEDNRHGRLVPSGKVDALADAMESVLGDDNSAGMMGQAGRQAIADHFSLGKWTVALQDVYSEVNAQYKMNTL